MLYKHAQQSMNMLSSVLSKDVVVMPLHDYYPGLFDDPEETGTGDAELQMQQYKAAMENFSMRHNRKFYAEGGEEDGD